MKYKPLFRAALLLVAGLGLWTQAAAGAPAPTPLPRMAQGFYQPKDYLLIVQVGWESGVLHGVLRSDDLKLAVGKKGAEPVRLRLAPAISGQP